MQIFLLLKERTKARRQRRAFAFSQAGRTLCARAEDRRFWEPGCLHGVISVNRAIAMKPLVALTVVLLTEGATLNSAAAFNMGFGTPIEERMGSDYGAEYYYRNSGSRNAATHRISKRCHIKVVRTENGVRRLKRCR
jgi:hypothetical protein